jgi:hypothetical protein
LGSNWGNSSEFQAIKGKGGGGYWPLSVEISGKAQSLLNQMFYPNNFHALSTHFSAPKQTLSPRKLLFGTLLALHTSCTLEVIERSPDEGDDENQVYEKFQECKLPSSGHCVWLNANEPFGFAPKGKGKRKDQSSWR